MKLVVFAAFGLYSKLWRFVDQKDLEAIVKAVVVATVVLIAALFLLSLGRTDPPRGVIALDFLLTLAFVTGARFLCARSVERRLRGPILERARREVLIVGRRQRRPAGGLRAAPQPRPARARRSGSSTTTRASRACAWPATRCSAPPTSSPRVLDDVKPDEVIIAIPSAPGILRQKVVTACRERGIPVRTLPTTFELLSGGVNLMRQVREVRVEDVLGREPVRVEIDRVGAYLRGRVVLVTGAGGSIGAELSRQIARVGAEPAGAGRERRERALRDPPRARGGAPLRACRGGARRLQGRHAHARGVRRAARRRSCSTRPPTSTCR